MGNIASKWNKWLAEKPSINSNQNNQSSINHEKENPPYSIPEHLNGLLSLVAKEKLSKVQQNKYEFGIIDKKYTEYNVDYPRIISGTIAEDFQNYLKQHSPENCLKLSFLIITELVLEGKDPDLFHHLASVFFDRQGSFNINLRNQFAQDKLFEHLASKDLKFEECLNLLKKKGKLGPDMLTRNDGINTVYKEFREFKIREDSKRCACLLSIL